ncbi:MAG: hypothetical protein SV487_09190 [Thermodesulfobacteriota bacterium]|nr:hypothetical protein [Thermodesulfobacteriota bacterium]
MDAISITYCFKLDNGAEEVFRLQLDPQDLSLTGNTPAALPSWTNIDFHQCPNCPLTVNTHPHCPVAVNFVDLVERFDGLLSHDKTHLDVLTEEREVSKDTTVQRGISSLMGLIISASGCPHTEFFKPMARFHLPLASDEETIYRSTSMYLLAQYFLRKEGKVFDLELKGLVNIYKNVDVVNMALVERLRQVTESDSTVNAVILLDMFAKTLPLSIEEYLEEISYLFTPYLASAAKE